MIRKSLGLTEKEFLKLKERDKLTFFLLMNGQVRGALLHGSLLVRQAAANHELGPLETQILGQALLAGGLLASTLKGDDRIQLSLKTDGLIGGFSVDADAYGEIRGYLMQNPIRIPADWVEIKPDALWGQGILTVNKTLEGKAMPFSGSVEFLPGDPVGSLINYFDSSEQISTAMELSLPFDTQGNLESAAGLLIQALPGCPEDSWNSLAKHFCTLGSLGSPGIESLENWFNNFDLEILGSRRVEFLCRCSKDRFSKYLGALPPRDKEDLASKGPFPLEILCHNCGSAYYFSQAELLGVFASKN